LRTDPKPRIANLANYVRLAAHQFDLLFLAKTHLTQTMRNLWSGGKLLDTDGCAGNHAAQWAEEWFAGAFTFA
jgi:hypothetical protein